MSRTSQISLFVLAALILAMPGGTLCAPSHARTDYVRALHELRTARILLVRTEGAGPDKDADEATLAIISIDGAISEIHGAALVGAGDANDALQIDPHMVWKTRLVRSLELLDKAQIDCGMAKTQSGVTEAQTRASTQIDDARNRIRVAIATVNFNYTQAQVIR